jgi:hypothetical protein
MSANVHHFQTPGPYCFRIHGQVYHQTSTLHPGEGTDPKFGQLYILEGQQALDARLQNTNNQNCSTENMQLIQTVLDAVNPYAAAYKHMYLQEQEAQQEAARQGKPAPVVCMLIKQGPDQRRYNEPRHDEVAAVFVGEDGAPPLQKDIMIYPKDKPMSRLNYLSSNCDPMVYPLLFPRGDLGWVKGSLHVEEYRSSKRQNVTHLQHYSYRFAIRDGFSAIHYSGKLFQQYIVDAYVKTEASRLDYIRRNQAALRVELYTGLMDHVQRQNAARNLPAGKVVVLPSSYAGSPRAMQQNFQDAMAIVCKFGKPDLFLTFTCNPRLPEIVNNLKPNQQLQDRPDLVARVFKLHLKELLKDITDRHVLGMPVAHVHVIEFQKRGLPHAHLLLILAEASKLRDSHDIDRLISAEIPDPQVDAALFDVVKSCMVHGPCGVLKPGAVCMQDGKCSKEFPKLFCEQTIVTDSGYPSYRRPDNGSILNVAGHELDNRWIVPYNPELSKKFCAHINLEACMSIKSVKYLFKYVYKGHDCANIEIVQQDPTTHDEISDFLDARYVSPPEAFWRLSEYPLHGQSHTIIRLAVHMPNNNPVYFTPGQEEEAVNRETANKSQLTAWFELNRVDCRARQYLYTEVPNHYVFDGGRKQWKPRKLRGDTVISRMYAVRPAERELCCLRMLLLHVPGA